MEERVDKQAILQKYNKDEDHILVSKVLNKIEISNKKNKIVSTDFFDLYQKKIVQNVLNKKIINLKVDLQKPKEQF